MNGEILKPETAEKLKKYQDLLIYHQILKNENKRLKEEIERLRRIARNQRRDEFEDN